jgi:hypothetical protein
MSYDAGLGSSQNESQGDGLGETRFSEDQLIAHHYCLTKVLIVPSRPFSVSSVLSFENE